MNSKKTRNGTRAIVFRAATLLLTVSVISLNAGLYIMADYIGLPKPEPPKVAQYSPTVYEVKAQILPAPVVEETDDSEDDIDEETCVKVDDPDTGAEPIYEPGAGAEVTQETDEVEDIEEDTVYSEKIPLDGSTQASLLDLCDEYKVPLELILAVIETESNFDPDAYNGGCYGYMQINQTNLKWLGQAIGVTDLTDPLQNLHSGVYMLWFLYERYENWNTVLMCYNAGEQGAYDTYFSKGYSSSPYSEYVLNLQKEWEAELSA